MTNLEPSAPPKPRPVLRVGIVGHRDLSGGSVERIQRDLSGVLGEIFKALSSVVAECDAYYSLPSEVRVVTSLATGADSIGAKAGLELRMPLYAILPFVRSEYRLDFEVANGDRATFEHLLGRATTVLELDGSRDQADRTPGYVQSGLFLLQHVDILIAVWDVPDAQAKTERVTSRIVREARAVGMPVVVVDAKGTKNPWLRASDGTETILSDDEMGLVAELGRIVLPPHLQPKVARVEEVRRRYEEFISDFFHETPPLASTKFVGLRARAWGIFKRSFARGCEAIDPPQAPNAPAPTVALATSAILDSHFTWLDHLAVHFMSLYRSSFVINYLFGALAVTCALLPLLISEGSASVMFYFCEIALIGMILGNYYFATLYRWHERALDYRILAELVRHARVLYAVGGIIPHSRPPTQYTERGVRHWTWVQWLFRAIVRDAGIPAVRIDEVYVRQFGHFIQWECVQDQLRYHVKTKAELKHVEETVHVRVQLLFYCTLAAVVMHVILFMLEDHVHVSQSVELCLTIAAAAIPAWAAALHGIAAQAELGAMWDRSAGMVEELGKLNDEIVSLMSPTSVSGVAVIEEARHVAEIMLHEVLDWRIMHQGKEPPLS